MLSIINYYIFLGKKIKDVHIYIDKINKLEDEQNSELNNSKYSKREISGIFETTMENNNINQTKSLTDMKYFLNTMVENNSKKIL